MEMNCAYCTQSITETEAKATVPCCTALYHTTCLIKHTSTIANNSYHSYSMNILCQCGVVLYSESHEPIVPMVEPELETPEARRDIKDLKKKISAANKHRLAFARLLREKKQEYSEATGHHLVALREINRTMKTCVKNTEEYKAHVRGFRSYTAARREFVQKYKVNSYIMRTIIKDSYRYRLHTPMRMLRRILRIIV
jgi:hypothetical protein